MSLQKSSQTVELTPAQLDYVAFTAMGGLLPSDDNFGVKMSAATFAQKVGVDRTTLYRWRETIPDFWDKVNETRRQLGGKDRLQNVWNAVYMKAAGGDTQAAKMYLANHDPTYREPTQPVEHNVGNAWAALLTAKQEKLEQDAQIIDVEDISSDE